MGEFIWRRLASLPTSPCVQYSLVRRILLAGLLLLVGCISPSASQGSAAALQTSSALIVIGRAILDLNLHQQNTSHWFPYSSIDSPEGGYMGWMFAGETALDALITLPRPLPPGNYSVFIKGINYDNRIQVRFAAGGGDVTLVTDDRDWNRYWSDGGLLQVRETTSMLRLMLMKRGPLGDDAKFLLRGLYLTERSNIVVTSTDIAVDLTYPIQRDDSVSEAGNLVENGSFEVGLGHGWGVSSNRTFALNSIWDQTTAYHGRASVKLPLDASARTYGTSIDLLSRVYTVKPNKRYTLSMWVKTNGPASVRGDLRILNSFTPPPGYPARHELTQHFIATREWQRVSVTGYLLKYPTPDYQILISAEGGAGQFLWIDAVQLVEGPSLTTTYQPRWPLEIGLVSGQPGNLFYEDEPIVASLLVANTSTRALDATIHFEIYDYLNQRVKQDTQTLNVVANAVQRTPLDLATGRRGVFRVVLWAANQADSREELNYAILPRPQQAGPDPTSSIGIHSEFRAFQFDMLRKLGIKWTRAMSPAALFRWSTVEPVNDQFIWYDSEVRAAIDGGATILGTIGSNNYWPTWADENGLPNLDHWAEFVEQLVSHYKSQVHYWEIWNEPYAAFPSRQNQAGFYAQMLKRAIDVIERIDPSAQVIAMGGSPLDYVKAVITELEARYPGWPWQAHIAGIATHLYPEGEQSAVDFRREIVGRYGTPVWNTETGVWDQGFYLGANSNFVLWGDPLLPPTDETRYYETSPTSIDDLTQNFLQTIGAGLSKYFYYDSRIAAAPDYLRSHPTLLEYDDSIRPKGIAYAILAQLFDHAQGLGKLDVTDADTTAYLFKRRGLSIIALWTTDHSNKWLTLAFPAARYRVYDVMGNVITITDSKIPVGRTPIYIEEQPTRYPPPRFYASLDFAIRVGTISSRTDITPPNLSFSTITAQTLLTAPIRFRWLAIDETSSPTVLNPHALLYAYQIMGPAGEEPWTDWMPSTYLEYRANRPGAYTLRVRAKDLAGNVSNVIESSVQVTPR